MHTDNDIKTSRLGTKNGKSQIALFCTFQLRGILAFNCVRGTYEVPKHFHMKSHQLKIVKDDEESDTEQTKSLLEDYRNELVEIKAQPATPVVTIIDKNIVEAAVTTVYVLLRKFARPNEEWAKKADYIEFLYTDEAEHQAEIQRLWVNRRKRLEQGLTR